ncbi:MAG: mechanosensitive ion channel [Lutibacter sp.]|jgi:small-conductance mechanosensitive channel|uniref:mechanosensitive ion channel family protein n=1 Tax=Lutibacter sp. TaxID=1925666 RepID=UPI00299D3616|nr:mechanosensitive ion channel domain-containing protein [Lutibacter sp.]MDX1829138.1 mechanosensitive ion channel [Lutibacter sp.]
METLRNILNYTFSITDNIQISVKDIFVLLVVFFITSFLLKLIKRITNKKLDDVDKNKFNSLFSFLKYFIYVTVIIIALDSLGIKISVLLAGSAALLVGLGLGLQTLFQDIISGVFMLLDKTIHLNDVIEVDGKIGKVFEINLRTTRAITIEDKVVIIPNHIFLTNTLYNWTQNGRLIIETVKVGVAYGSDVEKVKKLLIEAAVENPKVSKVKMPSVLFNNFGDSTLDFILRFSTTQSFTSPAIKSELRFAIDKKFRENNIQIPFPQRDIHIIENRK